MAGQKSMIRLVGLEDRWVLGRRVALETARLYRRRVSREAHPINVRTQESLSRSAESLSFLTVVGW